MSNFTKGPWEISAHKYRQVEVVSQELGVMVARLPEWGDYLPETKSQLLENARLIAAAPDLYEACEIALNAFLRNDCIDWSILEKALAKAKGETK